MTVANVYPALSAEEWRDYLERGHPGIPLFDVRRHGPNDRHAVAALALHGQPFGFTWADVDEMADLIATAEAEGGGGAPLARSLADRIAALLLPRVDGGGEAR